jgi:hypothetical protein
VKKKNNRPSSLLFHIKKGKEKMMEEIPQDSSVNNALLKVCFNEQGKRNNYGTC